LDLAQAIFRSALTPDWFGPNRLNDDFMGRFEAVTLHMALVVRALRRKDAAHARFANRLIAAMFDLLDAGLRELGVGDLTVPKKLRVLSEAFHGRLRAYDAALDPLAPTDALAAALMRNMFDDQKSALPLANATADWVRRAADRLSVITHFNDELVCAAFGAPVLAVSDD